MGKIFSLPLVLTAAMALSVSACGVSLQQATRGSQTGLVTRVPKVHRVGVLPFDDTTRAVRFEWWSVALGEMLTTDLAKAKDLQVMERRQLHALLQEAKLSLSGLLDENSVKQVGKLAGVDFLVTGSYMLVDGRVRINARVLEVETGRVVASSSVVGTEHSLLIMEDGLARDLVEKMGYDWTESAAEIAEFPRPSSSNVEALKCVALGLSHSEEQRWDKADEMFRSAIQMDPKNYEAHFNLAWACQKRGLHEMAGGWLRKAILLKPESIDAQLLYGKNHDPMGYFNRVYERRSPSP